MGAVPGRVLLLAALTGAVTAALAGCTSSAGTPAPTRTVTSTIVTTVAPAAPPSVPAAPTTAVAARSCPLVGTAFVRDTMGMRLGRLTVLRSAGRVVGCRFYALQGSPLHASEHLPGPRQPVVEVVTQRFVSATAAHNALVSAARGGSNPQQVPFGRAGTGVCYQTAFYPKDRGRDWACGATLGTLRVLVRTVDTTGTFSTATLTRAVISHA
jgi:hypothetical protein